MMVSRKSLFSRIVTLLLITFIVVYGVIYFENNEGANIYSKEININKYVVEYTNTFTINENNNQTCDSSSGFCGPPSDWYSTN